MNIIGRIKWFRGRVVEEIGMFYPRTRRQKQKLSIKYHYAKYLIVLLVIALTKTD